MASFKSLTTGILTALSALSTLTTAYVTGFTAPAYAAVGSSFNATLAVASYPQQWTDLAVVWGLYATTFPCEECVGLQIGYTVLTDAGGEAFTFTFNEFDAVVTVPEWFTPGDYVLKAALPNVIGASGVAGYSYYSSNITITSSNTTNVAGQATS